MNIEILKELILQNNDPLPGWDYQKKASPPYRGKYDIEAIKRTNPKVASVMIMLYENEEKEVEFPIILRVIYNGIHSNQLSLPGGQFEEFDVTMDQTAVRETSEEVGVDEMQIEVLKQLTELYVPPSNFLIYPFIGYYPQVPEFVPSEEEVQHIIPINLEAFLEAEISSFEYDFSGNIVEMPGYDIGENVYLWGATAMILEEFKEFIKKSITL
ncbi:MULTISPECIES: NUDIX hydrolase [Weeksella]|uniref:NUDIX hydrolase n=1 Tax=Weeksella virosa (strain ATCC 43766 / DSM 16922 / JCM 21250 / CCUG 30538 / CDC 9751 / IAM 14551 / NBRC 16016 / NCTC 11634 / CL345/78) TaxID=865938 RepID=F0NZG2_WEEVC|nr:MULTISPECIES: CoA pyrophosphatase [Weeksella]ADX68309.1 NUDIX hydrolase [Weeksella virosa DSM 16922]MDK7374588.1 CoA pyrophosphatase [Weeksella virosa]MDK7674737.1 CoA pyrophosphatase [Weeksella virosa]OFM83094.1 coenzyme A pyrophosphatase [Weeksella sp. HMSC059D05]SUP54623.1 putative NUDIX hydrolase [Weeksella virosa]